MDDIGKLGTASLLDPSVAEDVRRKAEIDSLRRQLTPGKNQEQKLDEAAQGFEAIFIGKLWKQMRANVPREGYLHSRDEQFYLSMFDEEIAKKFTSAGGIGLSRMLKEQLREQLSSSASTTGSRSGEPIPLNTAAVPMEISGSEPIPLGEAAHTVNHDRLYEPMARQGAEPEADDRLEPRAVPLESDAELTAPARPDAPPAFKDSALARAMNLAARIELNLGRKPAASLLTAPAEEGISQQGAADEPTDGEMVAETEPGETL